MKTKIFGVIFVLFIIISIVAISGCVSQESSGNIQPDKKYVTDENKTVAGDLAITIKSDGFYPSELRIPVNTTVIWYNNDTKPHAIFMPLLNKGSIAINQAKSWSYKFNNTGDYPYHCSFYTDLKGKIVVVNIV